MIIRATQREIDLSRLRVHQHIGREERIELRRRIGGPASGDAVANGPERRPS